MVTKPDFPFGKKNIEDHARIMNEELSEIEKKSTSEEQNQIITEIAKREFSFISDLFAKEIDKSLDPEKMNLLAVFRKIMSLYNASDPSSTAFSSELKEAINILKDQLSLYIHLTYEDLIMVAKAHQALLLSEGSDLGLREKFTLEDTNAQTTNGSYYLDAAKGPLSSEIDQLRKCESARSFVVKPACQEAGCDGNPLGNRLLMKSGVEGGKGAIRERFAYSLQKTMGIDFGVPFTEVIRTNHLSLGILRGQVASFLRNNFEISDPSAISDLMARYPEVTSFSIFFPYIIKFIEEKSLEGAEPKIVFFNRLYEIHIKGEELSKAKLHKLVIDLHVPQEKRPNYFKMGDNFFKSLKLQSDIPPVVSVQHFIPSMPYGYLAPEVLESIPDIEMHKLIIDLMIFNLDRHMNNVLFDISSENPRMVLIDHGFSLPKADMADNLRNAARYEWYSYPQFKHALCDPYASCISTLDIDKLIEKIKRDFSPIEFEFGDYCRIPEECYTLLKFNLHLLKIGVALKVPVENMAFFHMATKVEDRIIGMEIVSIYKKFVENVKNPKDINWTDIDKEIEIILLKKIENRALSSY